MNEKPLTIINIHGVPRSGTSWLGQLFNSSPHVAFRFQPLFSYAFKDRLNERSTPEEISRFYSELLETKDEFVLQVKNISGKKEVDFKKSVITHLVMKEVRYHHILGNLMQQAPSVKVIGIVRHPCACISSWIKAPKEFDPSWDVMKEWRNAPSKNLGRKEEFNGFEKWKEVTRLFLQLSARYPDRFRLVRYEQLNDDTLGQLKALFAFSGLEITPQTLDFIHKSKNTESQDAYSVFRKGQHSDNWKKDLDPRIAAGIEADLEGTELQQFLS